MHKHLHAVFYFALATLFLSACTKPLAEHTEGFDSRCWPMTDTLNLEFNNDDVARNCQIFFPIKLSREFPFRNIFLTLKVTSPSGKENLLPYEFLLMDLEGNWNNGETSSETTFEIPLSAIQLLSEEGEYTFRIYHFMQDELLCGVLSAGIEIREMK